MIIEEMREEIIMLKIILSAGAFKKLRVFKLKVLGLDANKI